MINMKTNTRASRRMHFFTGVKKVQWRCECKHLNQPDSRECEKCGAEYKRYLRQCRRCEKLYRTNSKLSSSCEECNRHSKIQATRRDAKFTKSCRETIERRKAIIGCLK